MLMVRTPAAWGLALALCALGCSPNDDATRTSEEVASAQSPIVGGTPDTTTKAVVALTQHWDGADFGYCSGTLLAPNLVLTARHCISAILDEVDGGVDCDVTHFGSLLNFDNWSVSIQDNITSGAQPSLLFGMANFVVPQGNAVCGADIALVMLDGQGIPNNLARPIAPRLDSQPDPYEQMLAVGYGIQDPEDDYGTTFGQRMRFDDGWVYCVGGSDECEGFAQEREFIADAPTCSGDSGGPAIDDRNQVMGVLSRGDDLCSVAIYTEVSSFAPLIRAAAQRAAVDGGYFPPAWAGQPPDPPPDAGTTDSGTTEPDAGMTDAGTMMDSGVAEPDGGDSEPRPDGGSPDSGAPGPGGVGGPTIDPLGLSCNGDCPGNYACYAETGKPPGICVPYCGDGLPGCPMHYGCSTKLKACVPYEEEEGGCAVAAAPRRAGLAGGWLLISALFMLGLRRRRSVAA